MMLDVDVVTGICVVAELGLCPVELLTDAAADETDVAAEVLAVFRLDRKPCAVAMNDAALTVTALPPTTTVAAGLRASIEESRAGSRLLVVDCAAAPLRG